MRNEISPTEVVARGEDLYERNIRQIVEQGNHGKFVVIDIDSGDFEVDSEDLQATKRLLARHADAVIYGLRIGHKAAYRFGSAIRTEVG